MRLFGLVGYPLTHSFSKKYFTEKFEQEGLTDCRYELFPLASIDEFPELVKSFPSLVGLNVTIPYKKQVMKYLDYSEIPPGLGACNCIKIENCKLTGYNTDATGFEKSLQPLLKSYHKKALVLGNGGATAAVVFSLKKLGIEFTIVSRQLHNGSSITYADIDREIMKEHTLVINTTPLGMSPETNTYPDIPYEFLTSSHLLFDVVYKPPKTLFLQKGEEKGAEIKNGEEMLINQAEENWRIWSGS